MKSKPTLAEIYAAELKVSLSMQHTQASVDRVQVASRASAERVSAISLVVGAVGVSLMWLAHRRNKARYSAATAHVARNTSALGLVLAFLMRYGRIGMPFILQQVRARRRRFINSKRKLLSQSFINDYAATGLRH